MTPVLLIAWNLVRENRWPLLVLCLWPFFIAGIASGERDGPEEYVFILSTLFGYGLAYVLFTGAGAIHNERKTRRILAVLSKGVERWQYLAGILLGTMLVAAAYGATIGIANTTFFAREDLSAAGLWTGIGVMLTVALLGASIAVFYTTFLPPLFALMASGITLGLPVVLERWLEVSAARAIPVYPLLVTSVQVTQAPQLLEDAWPLVFLAVAEAAAFMLAASFIFERRDIAVAVE